jgi:hypothetical protein
MKDEEGFSLVEHKGQQYYEVKDFAYKTNRTTSTIYRLIKLGNCIRKLNAIIVLGKPLIPREEYQDFLVSAPGANGADRAVHFWEEKVHG